MVYCPWCGQQTVTAQFCQHCGKALPNAVARSKSQVVPISLMSLLVAAVAIFAVWRFMVPGHPTMTLLDAIALGRNDQVRANLYWGCDVNQSAPNGDSPLGLAVRLNDVEATKALLSAGADISVYKAVAVGYSVDPKGNYYSLPMDAAKIVLDRHSLESLNRFDVLKSAAENGNPEMIRYLISRGVDPNVTDQPTYPTDTTLGWTALHAAAYDYLPTYEPSLRALLAAGANPGLQDKEGKTPLDIARDRDDRDAIAFFSSLSK